MMFTIGLIVGLVVGFGVALLVFVGIAAKTVADTVGHGATWINR